MDKKLSSNSRSKGWLPWPWPVRNYWRQLPAPRRKYTGLSDKKAKLLTLRNGAGWSISSKSCEGCNSHILTSWDERDKNNPAEPGY